MKRYNQLSRLLALVLCIVLMTMCFAGCSGGKKTEETEPPSEIVEDTQPTEVVTEPPETEPLSVMGTVNTDRLNVRTKAHTKSASVTKLAIGTRLEILEILTVTEDDNNEITWGRIENGWVQMKFVTLDSEATESTPVVEDPGTVETQPAEVTTPETPAVSTPTGNGKMGTVTADTLNIRKGPGTKYDSVGKVKKGDRVEILETDGNWGKTSQGWISLKYVKMDGSSSSSQSTSSSTSNSTDKKYSTLVTDGNTKALGTVTVGDSALNVRYGPSTDYNKVSSVKAGETLTYYQKSGNWIRISNGWISYKYVTEGSSSSSSDKETTGTNSTFKEGSATVVVNSSLTIRESASSDAKKVGSYNNGDKVTILEVKGEWGRTDKGWINLRYVKY